MSDEVFPRFAGTTDEEGTFWNIGIQLAALGHPQLPVASVWNTDDFYGGPASPGVRDFRYRSGGGGAWLRGHNPFTSGQAHNSPIANPRAVASVVWLVQTNAWIGPAACA